MQPENTRSEEKPSASPDLTRSRLCAAIDHTLLKPDADETQIRTLCREARENGFFSVCIESKWLEVAVAELTGSPVIPITVVGFPSGAEPTETKTRQTREAVSRGAQEIDMVINREWLQTAKYDRVYKDIAQVVGAAAGKPVKVILETSELAEDQKAIACALSKLAGAAFVKTSTGFSSGGATVEDIRKMRALVGSRMGVKASGGVRNYEQAAAMIAAGATRLGTSASVAIVTGADAGGGGY